MRRIINIHGVDDVRLDHISPPCPDDADIVVDVRACGICGSDLTYIKAGGIHRQPNGVTPIGHELSGDVAYVGKSVTDITVGQRVILNPMTTPSAIGSGGSEGAFSDQVLVRQASLGINVFPVPDGISYDIAALAEPLAVALHGVNRLQARAGEKIVVFGCGPIGLAIQLWLLDRGIHDVIALDVADSRLARASALGVRAALNPTKINLVDALKKLHGTARVFSREAVGTDAYIDAAGATNILSDVVNMAKYQSRMVVTAAYLQPVQIPLGAMLTTEMSLTTAVGYPTEMPTVIEAMPRLKNQLEQLISHRFSLDNFFPALDIARAPSSAKVIINI